MKMSGLSWSSEPFNWSSDIIGMDSLEAVQKNKPGNITKDGKNIYSLGSFGCCLDPGGDRQLEMAKPKVHWTTWINPYAIWIQTGPVEQYVNKYNPLGSVFTTAIIIKPLC